MDKNFEKLYENRIYNTQWAAAKNYEIDPIVLGQNIDGNPDLYLNLIIGLSYKIFGFENIKSLFDAWEYNIWRNKYDMGLIYLLEDFVFRKYKDKRPALNNLRKQYAFKFLDDSYDLQRRNLALKENLIFRLEEAKAYEILGKNLPRMNKKQKDIYDNFYLPLDTNDKNIRKRVLALFYKYLSYKENYGLKNLPIININFLDRAGIYSLERSNRPSDFARGKNVNKGLTSFILNLRLKKRAEKLSYIEKTFGKSLFNEEKRLAIERDLCTGPHRKSKIYFTKGIEKEDKDLDQSLNKKAINRHMTLFKQNKNSYNKAISTLSKSIRLKLSQADSFSFEKSQKGRLISKIAYKALISDKANIFAKKTLITDPFMKVDLLVDASASILEKESQIAIEAYILSKSLENNNILNRLISYQTVSDFTILTVLKDYDEKSSLERIFRFKAIGWNRDGLVFKAYRALLDKDISNTLSLILTDANPSDFRPYINEGINPNRPYQEDRALKDTQEALDFLRKKHLNTAGILSSEKNQNAKKLFKNNYIKVNDLSQVAAACGKFIKKQIDKSSRR